MQLFATGSIHTYLRAPHRRLIAASLHRPPTVPRLPPRRSPAPAQARPAHRPQTAREVLAALDRVTTGTGASVLVPWHASRGRVALAIAAAVVVLSVAWVGMRFARARESGPVLEPKRVVVATFENRSGDRSCGPDVRAGWGRGSKQHSRLRSDLQPDPLMTLRLARMPPVGRALVRGIRMEQCLSGRRMAILTYHPSEALRWISSALQNVAIFQ